MSIKFKKAIFTQKKRICLTRLICIFRGKGTGENCEKAFKAKVSNIAISLDGLRRDHDFMRRKGSFDRIIKALDLLKEKGMSSSIVTSLNKNNIKELPQLKELLIQKGVDSWQMQIAVAMGNLLDHPHLILEPLQVDTIIDFAYQTNLEGKILVYLADCVGYYNLKEVEVRKMVNPSKKNYDGFWRGCPAGKNSFGIRCNGNIIGCTSIRDDSYIEANVRDIPLSELWEKEDAFAWNRNLTGNHLKGFCNQCQYAQYCLGGCTNVKITMDKSLRSPLKVAIIPTFRGIVVQVLIFRLKRAKKAFSAEIYF